MFRELRRKKQALPVEICERILKDGKTGVLALAGDGAALRADLGYLARRSDTADIDLTVEQLGKGTVSEINASGALMERAKKVFRGTIDFKHGSAGSVGTFSGSIGVPLRQSRKSKCGPVDSPVEPT